MRRLAVIALAALLAAPNAASAQDAASQDLACLVVVTMLMSQAKDPTTKQGIMTGIGYYLGRLRGRDPTIDLKGRLVVETKALVADTARFKAEAARCGADMQVWGREVQEASEALKAEGRRMQGQPAT